MSYSELMPIGSFARRSGLTASALRFYADSRLLLPAKVDPVTGYRFYREDQLESAVLLRQLREIGMPLVTAESLLDAEGDEAVRLVDEHVNTVVSRAEATRRQAALIKASLTAKAAVFVVAVGGPVLTAAIEQVLTATTYEPDIAVLNGIRFEVDSGAVTLTATDRYRLSTRTLVPVDPTALSWAATVNADDLRSCLADLRRTPLVRIEVTEHTIWMRLQDRGDRHCRLLTDSFPDYQLMLADLAAVTTRVQIPKGVLLRVLEARTVDYVLLSVEDHAVTLMDSHGQDRGISVPARVTGPSIEITFEMTTLYPAVTTAIGADVLLDLRGPDQPATIRSADQGDLTTLAIPANPQPRETNIKPKEQDE